MLGSVLMDFLFPQDLSLQQKLCQSFARLPSKELLENGVLDRFPIFAQRLKKFLSDHGHRETDFDCYHPTWGDSPWQVLDNVRVILDSPSSESLADKERRMKADMQRAEFELFKLLPVELHYFFAELIRLSRLYISLDDLEHYQTTRLTPALRRGLRELGLRLVERGVIEEPMDIFFARRSWVETALKSESSDRWLQLAVAIKREKELYLLHQGQVPKWDLQDGSELHIVAGECLSGLAGSPGQAEGEVFLVLSPEDFAHFPPKSVLVAKTTNPTWTPLFYSACAVITESGGPLSHGAVNAREMQIPAVMSVKGSMSRLKNGQRVRVDGSVGKVSLL